MFSRKPIVEDKIAKKHHVFNEAFIMHIGRYAYIIRLYEKKIPYYTYTIDFLLWVAILC